MRQTLLIPVFIAILVAAGCGDDNTAKQETPAEPVSAPAKPQGTPFPSGFGAELHAGTTYTTQAFKPTLEITPAPGKWVAEIGESETDLAVAKRGIKGQAILGFHTLSRVFDPRKGGKTPGDMVPAPDDFAAWLTGHPHMETSKPKRVTRMGLEGVRIDARAVSHPRRVPDECGRHADRCVPIFYDGVDMIFYTYGNVESRVRFYVLELEDGKQLVIEEYFEQPQDVKKELSSLEKTLAATKLGTN